MKACASEESEGNQSVRGPLGALPRKTVSAGQFRER